MGYTAPTTRAAGYKVPASVWNTDLVDNITFLANPPACRVYHGTTQSLTDNTEATVAFNSERFDPTGMHDTAVNNSRITFTTAGLYVITYHAEIAAGNDYTYYYAYIRLNGTTGIAISSQGTVADAGVSPSLNIMTVYKMAASDYIEVRTAQNNSANTARNILSQGNMSPEFAAVWVGLG